jgi:hypothetical protein
MKAPTLLNREMRSWFAVEPGIAAAKELSLNAVITGGKELLAVRPVATALEELAPTDV